MRHMMTLAFLVMGCSEEPAPYDPGPVACDILQADEACPRRLLCCDDAAACWVETADEVVDCGPDDCADAFALTCSE
jgi:hypothetical protein